MSYLQTRRLIVRPIDVAEARRIRAGAPAGEDQWADGYPFEGDLVALGAFLHASEEHGEQSPFGYYQLQRRSDGQAVGGIGYKGPPVDGTVEIGYGLIPGARGEGYAAEALSVLLASAREHGVTRVVADTTHDNIASQRTLLNSGFEQVAADDELLHYAVDVGGDASN